MKKCFLFMTGIAAIVLVGSLSSCSSSDGLSSRAIVKQFNEQMKENAENKFFANIEIGKYECNDSEIRAQLRTLKAAGLITYDVERYAWWEKSFKSAKEAYEVTHGVYWYTYTTTEYRWVKKVAYNFEDHYVVTIGLTPKGEKLVIEEVPVPDPKIDKDLVEPEINFMDYEWNKKDITEDWPEIENPFIEKRESQPDQVREPNPKEEKSKEVQPRDNSNEEDKTERIDAARYEAYKALSLRSETVIFKTFEVSATKARNIRIGKDGNGFTIAEAEVITKTCNVTDAGRILERVENNLKDIKTVSLTYFEDKGWVLDDKEESILD